MKFPQLIFGIVLVLATALGLAVIPALAQEPSAEQKFLAELKALSWQAGPSDGKIASKASVAIPKGYVFLSALDTSKFLTLMGNLPRQDSYMLAPDSLEWFAVFDFEETGYVRDDEKLDPDAILQGLKEGNIKSIEARKSRGLHALYLEGWFVSPHYDLQTKRLEWATKLRSESGAISVNYSIRLLGRSGVMNATLVSEPAALEKDMRAYKATLIGFSFDAGERYSEYRTGDKIAEYGLTGLIIGGAAAAAAKTGIFKVIGKFGFIIVAGLGALVLGLFRRLSRFTKKAT